MTILREIELLTWFNGIEKLKSILKRLLAGNTFVDAPSDGKQYARQDGQWVEVISGSGFSSFQAMYNADPANTQITNGINTITMVPTGITTTDGDIVVGFGIDGVGSTETSTNKGASLSHEFGLELRTNGVFNALIKSDDITEDAEYQVPDESGVFQLQP